MQWGKENKGINIKKEEVKLSVCRWHYQLHRKPKEFTDYLEEWANSAGLQNTVSINKNQLYFIIANNWKWNKNSILIALRP